MINQSILTDVVLNQPGLVNKPLWQQLALHWRLSPLPGCYLVGSSLVKFAGP
ncbi:hypothetical protein [Pectobacterium versatile]|uniref:hypothetical protein n=1 Tax=Pectobacterium versatile TaxID=2488639 RepID=UPI001FFDB004|nr:hypothetical protein [Pectobacterium versatile]